MNYRRAIDAVQLRLWPRTAQIESESIASWDLRAILIGLMVPTSMTVLNMNMFGVAVPAIRNSFGIEADTVAWLITAYTLPFVVFMPLYGRLGDGLGKRKLFTIGILLFFLGTLLCLIANNLAMLIGGRVLQGVGTAGVNPLCIAVIAELFPDRERGRALSLWSATGPATGMIAPLAGGWLVDLFGWQSMFWSSLVAAAVAIWVVRGYVPRLAPMGNAGFLQTFDWIGTLLLGGAIVGLVSYLSSRSLTGVEPLQDWRLALATVVFGVGFWLWEKRHPQPLVPFAIFRLPNFSRVSIVAGLRMILMSSEGFLIPLYVADIYGASGTQIGMMITIQAGLLLAAVRIGAWLAERWGRRWPVIIGFSLQTLAMLYFANLPLSAPFWMAAMGAALHGWGAGLSLALLHRLVMDNVPGKLAGSAAGLYSMIRFFGNIIGATLGGVILAQALAYFEYPIDAYHLTFMCWAGVGLVTLLTFWPIREAKSEGQLS